MSISTTYLHVSQSFAGEIRQVSLYLEELLCEALLLLLSVPDFSSQPQSTSYLSSAARFLHLTYYKRIADAYTIRNK